MGNGSDSDFYNNNLIVSAYLYKIKPSDTTFKLQSVQILTQTKHTMKTRHTISVLLATFILVACNDSKPKETTPVLTSYPLEQTTPTGDLAPYIDSVEVIPLEVKEESYITHITKILLTQNKEMIIRNSTGILFFNADGTFRTQIGKQGRGPEEYPQAADICLDQTEKNLLVIDFNNHVYRFSLENGHLIEKIIPEFPQKYPPCEGIAPSRDGGFFLLGCNPFEETDFENEFYCLHQFDKAGKHLAHFLLRDEYVLTPHIITQSYDNSYLIRPLTGDKICYRIQNGQVNPFIKIDFKEQHIPLRYASFQPGEGYNLQKFLFSPYYKLPIYLHDTQDQFYFCYAAPKNPDNIFSVINKKSLKGISWRIDGSSNPNLLFGSASDENFIYFVFHDYTEYPETDLPTAMDPLKKYLIARKGIKLEGENSNPLIVKIKFNI